MYNICDIYIFPFCAIIFNINRLNDWGHIVIVQSVSVSVCLYVDLSVSLFVCVSSTV